jgi:pimeloyl-ACP methyl ester carboxylesterase
MSSTPTSHFITLPNRPIVQENGEITQGSLQLHYWEWQGHQPTILVCHGGTLHGRCYDRIITEALSGYHVISLDLRGHGRSQKHPVPYLFQWFGGDVYQFIEILDLSKNNLIGIGHSLGGHALTLAAAIAPKQLFQSLLLLDPGIFSLDIYQTGEKYLEKRKTVIDRNNQWSSIEDMISTMEKPYRFSQWPKEILRDFCTYALDENFKLQCTPECADHIYQESVHSDSNIYQIIKDSKFIHNIPIHVVRASKSFISSNLPVPPTAPDLATWFKKGRDTLLKDENHSFPMEKPEIVIHFIKEIIEENKNLFSHL